MTVVIHLCYIDNIMRATTTLSFPADMLNELKESAKKAKLSLSAYVQRMFRMQKSMISEEELLEDIRLGEEEYKRGECTVLESDEDIDDFFDRIKT